MIPLCGVSILCKKQAQLVVTKSEEAKAYLNKAYKEGNDFDVTMRVICHGHVPADLLDILDDNDVQPSQPTPDDEIAASKDGNNDDDDVMEEDTPTVAAKDLLKSLKIVQITRSNNADYLSTLDLGLRPPVSTIAIRSLFYYRSPYPIVGNSTYTKFLKSSRDKGLCMSVTQVRLVHPVTGKRMTWTASEPDKFELLRAREQKFWRRKLDEKLAALEKAGLLAAGSGQDNSAIDDNQEEKGRPLAYIVGEKMFYGLLFKVTDACLIPRPSTETLVDAVLAQLSSDIPKDGPRRILDIGTGCGNVLLSILHASAADVKGVGVDISNEALSIAKGNQARLGIDSSRVEWEECDMALLNDRLGMFDVVVCNPPYLNKKTIEQQKNEFRMLAHEPAQALFADDDGYEWYKVLSEVTPTLMHRRSKLVLECGKGMMDRVKLIMSGWKTVEIRKDKQGWDRCLVLELE
ncbi:S-adenosyl-L-methionine-dependent methyltransferase [Dichotomocladium elegans]|nr:S-adenosyl-L-methionine-dependent methyltransferase [Dichotomocladium elegans]